QDRVPPGSRVRGARIVEAVEGQMAHEHILRIGIIEDAEPGANNRSLVPRYVPCDAHAWCDVLVVRLIEPALTNNDVRTGQGIEIREVAVFFLDEPIVVIAQ